MKKIISIGILLAMSSFGTTWYPGPSPDPFPPNPIPSPNPTDPICSFSGVCAPSN